MIVIGTYGHGIQIYDQRKKEIYKLSATNPWSIEIFAGYLYQADVIDDKLWLATEQGVYVVDSSFNLVEKLDTTSKPKLISNIVRTIVQDNDGQVWLGTTEGVSIYAPSSNEVFSISKENDVLVSLKSLYTFKVFKDSKGSIWLGSFTDGLHRYNKKTLYIKHYISIPHSEISISDNKVWAFAENSDGLVWIATQSGGLNLFDPYSGVVKRYIPKFPHSVWDIAIDINGKLWIASSDGIFVFTHDNKKETLIPEAHLLGGSVIESLVSHQNKVWIVSNTGSLSWLSTDELTFHNVKVADSRMQSVSPKLVDTNNNLWLISNLGVSLYNLDSKEFNHLVFNGLQRNITLSSTNSVLETADYFWLSTLDNGIFKVSKTDYSVVQHIDENAGLSNDVVLTMVLTGGSLWVATLNQGIDQIDPVSGKIVRYITKEMLEFNELNEGAGLVASTGNMLFGGTKGFHIFNPDRLPLLDNRVPPDRAPLITGLSIFNQRVELGHVDSPLQSPVHLSSSISLANDASPFSLEFALVNPKDSSWVSYRYQLSGLSEKWLVAERSIRQATFTNLGFGNYTFRVQARELDGPWSPATELKIHVKAPAWLHRYALIAYAFVAFLLLSYWYRQYQVRKTTLHRVRDSEERLKLTLWSSGDELWDWDIKKGEIFRSNIWGSMDFPQDNQRVFTQLEPNIHHADLERTREALSQHLQGETEFYETTYRVRDFRDNWIWILDRGKVVSWDSQQKPLRMTGTLKNISHLKQAEEQLKLFKRSIETISDGVFITDTSFRIISVNQAYCNQTGDTREQALASYLTFHQYPPAFTEEVRKTLSQKGNWSGEVESVRHNGERYEIDLNIDAIHDENDAVSHYVGVFSDITSRKRTEKELLQLANTDTLTGLPNRSFFQASHQNLVRKGTAHALLCMDMDNFKKINDSMGHQTGDMLIKQIAARLQKLTGTSATSYRLGGDEFSILIESTTDIHRITHLAQRILDEMARSFVINRQEFVLGASVGIAFYPEDGASPQELLKNADTAMYFAKNAGGNKYQFFSGEMNQNAVRQLQIENLIRHGIKEDLFSVFYQPKVDIASGQLVSMEALVRFEHPEKGIVSPDQFIPLAEETGQIIEIGEIVLRKACEDTQRWVKQGLFTGRVAINISARQFELPDLDQRIEQVLRQTGLSPLHLECEITEGTLMQRPEQSLALMQRLREMGIHLALDDFGTGYSSLAYLKRFPLNTLKIDKAFIDDIATSSVDRHMTSAIITIAHNLGLKVVAEGVEEEQQLSILRRYECEMLQGYLYSKPLNAERFTKLLQENRRLTRLIKQNNL
nr:EAL domain-containing protein [Bowmanella dokdonensis]